MPHSSDSDVIALKLLIFHPSYSQGTEAPREDCHTAKDGGVGIHILAVPLPTSECLLSPSSRTKVAS